jgi:hypothetical protein
MNCWNCGAPKVREQSQYCTRCGVPLPNRMSDSIAMSTESKANDSFWIALTGVVTIFLAIWGVYTYYKPNDPTGRVVASVAPPIDAAGGVTRSSPSSGVTSQVQRKRRLRTSHHHVEVTPVANAEANAPQPNLNAGAPALSDWDLQQKAWCEQGLKIYESNPSFYGPGPLDALRAHHCDRWIGIPD